MKIVSLVGEELCKSIKETRERSEKYEEVVFFSKDVSGLNRILTEKLGHPLVSREKIEIEDTSKEILSLKKDAALKLANSFGGISKGQTLYHGTYNLTEILIMIWPWQDKTHLTLKKVIIKNAGQSSRVFGACRQFSILRCCPSIEPILNPHSRLQFCRQATHDGRKGSMKPMDSQQMTKALCSADARTPRRPGTTIFSSPTQPPATSQTKSRTALNGTNMLISNPGPAVCYIAPHEVLKKGGLSCFQMRNGGCAKQMVPISGRRGLRINPGRCASLQDLMGSRMQFPQQIYSQRTVPGPLTDRPMPVSFSSGRGVGQSGS